jgi:glycosyltransferase involved in cell wall biosynthesis
VHEEASRQEASEPRGTPELTVVIPVSERYDAVRPLFTEYKRAVYAVTTNVEFLYVLDGTFESVFRDLLALRAEGEPIRIVRLSRQFGEATALSQGAEHAASDTLLVLPAYYQVEPASLTDFIAALGDEDLVVVRRWPRLDSKLNRLGTSLFHSLLHVVTGFDFRDVGCGVRLIRRRIFDEINVYGDQHRFLAMLAAQRGFRVREVELPQARQDPKVRVYRPVVYLRRVLDLLAVFFLVRFTKRPLRFFGLAGSALIVVGLIILAIVTSQRLLLDFSLADRPTLLLGALSLVLGVQLFALGLIGELIIFTHARELKEYTVAETVNMEPVLEETPGRTVLVQDKR